MRIEERLIFLVLVARQRPQVLVIQPPPVPATARAARSLPLPDAISGHGGVGGGRRDDDVEHRVTALSNEARIQEERVRKLLVGSPRRHPTHHPHLTTTHHHTMPTPK